MTEMKEVDGELIKCPKCGHKWDYTGKSNRLQCRKCGKWFQRKYSEKLDKKQILKVKNKGIKGEPVECPKCGHKWDYTGKSNRLQCPRCGKWFQRKYSEKLDKKQILKVKNKDLFEKTLAFLANDFDPVTDRKYLMKNVTIVLGNNLTTQVKKASKTRRIMELDLIRRAVKKYLKETYTTKIKNKGLSEKTLAFLGTDFDSVTDRSFPRDKISVVLESDLTIQVKHASKTRKITEYNLIRLAVKKYLERGE